MKNIKLIVPNIITSINLLCGVLASVFLLEDHIWMPVYFLLFSAVADLLDGLTAKLLNATSEFGKQFDSLADVISFGLAPSIFMYKMLNKIFINNDLIAYLSLILVVFSALRLARFNIQAAHSSNFIGMPVPASAMFVVSIWILDNAPSDTILSPFSENPYVLIGVVLLLSFLMISNLGMLSLKFDGGSFRINLWRYVLLFGSLILIILFRTNSLIYVMLYYVLLSMIKNVAQA